LQAGQHEGLDFSVRARWSLADLPDLKKGAA